MISPLPINSDYAVLRIDPFGTLHTSGRKRRSKTTLKLTPIEEVTEFNIEQYIRDLPCGMSIGQAAKAVSTYRRGLQHMLRRTRKANYIRREILIK